MASIGCSSLATEPQTIDARGLKCPLPVLKLEKALDASEPGTEITVLATDPMAEIDIPLYCRQRGHACSGSRDGDVLRFNIVAA
jgi:tRNA 2-thiouridine synthesizing protein A